MAGRVIVELHLKGSEVNKVVKALQRVFNVRKPLQRVVATPKKTPQFIHFVPRYFTTEDDAYHNNMVDRLVYSSS
jgi:hypothetical protein